MTWLGFDFYLAVELRHQVEFLLTNISPVGKDIKMQRKSIYFCRHVVSRSYKNAFFLCNALMLYREITRLNRCLLLQVTEENVHSVLCFADVYLLNGLKRLCSHAISTFLDTENVLPVLRTSRLFNLPKLEADCCEYVSKHLEKVRKN